MYGRCTHSSQSLDIKSSVESLGRGVSGRGMAGGEGVRIPRGIISLMSASVSSSAHKESCSSQPVSASKEHSPQMLGNTIACVAAGRAVGREISVTGQCVADYESSRCQPPHGQPVYILRENAGESVGKRDAVN